MLSILDITSAKRLALLEAILKQCGFAMWTVYLSLRLFSISGHVFHILEKILFPKFKQFSQDCSDRNVV